MKKNKFLSLIVVFLFAFNALSDFKSDIKINSNSIEFLKESKKINFFDSVEINSKYVNIKAESATYDQKEDVISFSGKPSIIKSKRDGNLFNGKAEKILFFNDEEVHLIGNASMKYEDISISSNIIIFNPQSGKMTSGWKFMLEVKQITKSIKDKKILSQISFEVGKGEIYGLLGPNGAGKTTTFYIIAGLINSEEGKILLLDEDISDLQMHKRSKLGIKYLPQEPSIFQGLTVYENLRGLAELSLQNQNDIKEFIESSIEEFGLSEISNLKGRQLSGGQRRKVEIARTLAAKPKVILMDEPFAGIDPIAIEDIKNVLKKLVDKNIGILITDHNVRETLEICNQAAIINNGEIIAEGDKDELINNKLVKKVYLGDMYN